MKYSTHLRRFHALPFLALVLLGSTPTLADEIVLKNGDRLTGTLVRKSGDVLVLRSPYAGELQIAWHAVASLRSDKAVEVLLEGERRPLRSVLTPTGVAAVAVGPLARAVPLGRIAFINPRPEESGVGISWKGNVNLSASRSSGNTRSERDYGDADVTARSRDWRFNASGKVNRGRQAGVTTADSWLASGNADRFMTKKRFRYARASLEHDALRDLELRSTLGAGYGAQLLDDERSDVSLRGGVDHVYENRRAAPDTRYPAFGWGVKASHRLSRGGLQAFHEQDGFWNLRKTRRVTLRSRTGLRMPIVSRLSASAQVNVDWDRAAAPGRKSTDTTWLLGLTYSF